VLREKLERQREVKRLETLRDEASREYDRAAKDVSSIRVARDTIA